MELYHEADKLLDASGNAGWKEKLDNWQKEHSNSPDLKRFVAMVRGRAAIRGWI
jgi:hypothetical protein